MNSQMTKLIVTAVVSLVIGYFAGREHLKYEMRSALSEAAAELQKGLNSVFGGAEPPSGPAPSKAQGKRSAKLGQPEKPTENPTPTPQPIAVTLTSKKFRGTDFEAGRYQEAITFALKLDNRTGKDVRAFEGTLMFYDLLDNPILASKLTITDAIKTGASIEWKGQIDYNQFLDRHQRLASEDLANLKVTFEASKVLFGDGTTELLE